MCEALFLSCASDKRVSGDRPAYLRRDKSNKSFDPQPNLQLGNHCHSMASLDRDVQSGPWRTAVRVEYLPIGSGVTNRGGGTFDCAIPGDEDNGGLKTTGYFPAFFFLFSPGICGYVEKSSVDLASGRGYIGTAPI